jgi:hypothetical protein
VNINEMESLMKSAAALRLPAMAVAGILAIAAGTPPCYAEQTWAQEHKRSAQVGKRLDNQDARIDQGVNRGMLTQEQGTQYKEEDALIRQKGTDMASATGQITQTEQSELNQQADVVSKQIDQEKKDNKKQ